MHSRQFNPDPSRVLSLSMADQDDVRRITLALQKTGKAADRFAFSVPNGGQPEMVRIGQMSSIRLGKRVSKLPVSGHGTGSYSLIIT
jgi:hypothetical protein